MKEFLDNFLMGLICIIVIASFICLIIGVIIALAALCSRDITVITSLHIAWILIYGLSTGGWLIYLISLLGKHIKCD